MIEITLYVNETLDLLSRWLWLINVIIALICLITLIIALIATTNLKIKIEAISLAISGIVVIILLEGLRLMIKGMVGS